MVAWRSGCKRGKLHDSWIVLYWEDEEQKGKKLKKTPLFSTLLTKVKKFKKRVDVIVDVERWKKYHHFICFEVPITYPQWEKQRRICVNEHQNPDRELYSTTAYKLSIVTPFNLNLKYS